MERQLINALLAIAAVSADSALLVVNRFALSSTLSVVLAMMPLSDLTVVDLLQGASLSIADALFPIVLVNAYDGRYQRRTSQDNLPDEDRKRFISPSLLFRMQQECGNFWSILRHVTFLSTVLLVAHVFVSGELRSIQEDCYVLDVGILRWLLAAGGILNGTVLILMALLTMAASPVMTTFLAAPMNAFQLAIFMYTGFNHYRWIGLSVCWALGLAFLFFPTKDNASNSTAATRKSYSFARNVIITVVLCGALYCMNGLGGGSSASLDIEAPTCQNSSSVESKIPWPKALNYTSAIHDDYLGTRPHVDTVANLTFLVEQCKEIEDGGGVDDVVNCLSILKHAENEYFSIPKKGLNARASEPDVEVNHHGHAIAEDGSLVNHHGSFAAGQDKSDSFIGTCAGPVIPFHVYWTGSATWRVELFIKAYLYTQNLPCSRLWLWLDSDLDAHAVEKMLCEDAIFQSFRPLVARGDIVLKSWTFPDRVPLARESAGIASTPDLRPSMVTEDGETVLANGIVMDAYGQQWLNLKSPHASLAPVQVSDAVRFIVLHLHGGVYCDMDVLLLRDMRPLLLPDPTSGSRAFAEQWVERCAPYDYNTAVISIPANSSLSSYLLRGGVRMGMNFHPRVIGRMLWDDGKGDEVKMLHNAVFDPLVTNLRREGTGTCTMPCHKNFESAFMGEVEEKENEWSNYHGEVVEGLQGEGVVGNRSLGNFFKGAWAYHIHNQTADGVHSGGNSPNRPPGWTSSRGLKMGISPASGPTLTASGGKGRCWRAMIERGGRGEGMALGFVNSDGGSGIQMLFQTWKGKSGRTLALGEPEHVRAFMQSGVGWWGISHAHKPIQSNPTPSLARTHHNILRTGRDDHSNAYIYPPPTTNNIVTNKDLLIPKEYTAITR
ncbi:hypothetical protein HO133_006199 [Letharia lupina]|uniref:Uncharacterized protein n=1 Tax=Letharia lupina TaxID=560253 RepID=A0A8H6F841_9LECA|nr:uncharacterized protein HO133_006199 [Letharia lupina]KAF6218238.1 hypothetical protein HO133_006199 [Letharia lupina]